MKRPGLLRRLIVMALAVGCCGGLLVATQGQAGESDPKTAEGTPGAGERAGNRWTLGILTGPSPFELSSPHGIVNPVLTARAVSDLGTEVSVLAHPFMMIENFRHYLFFTVKGAANASGIGLAESEDGLEWKYRQIVLREPFTLAHPCVVRWRGDHYMIPESATTPGVRLYRAVDFPTRWEYVKELVGGDILLSASLVHFAGRWWMFAGSRGNDTLRLFFADELTGPWTEHPQSPVVVGDRDTARPGGRPIVIGGRLHRMGQDCDPSYGNQVFAYQVREISPSRYREMQVESPVVKATGTGWNAEAMHHVDAWRIGEQKWLAAVDALGR